VDDTFSRELKIRGDRVAPSVSKTCLPFQSSLSSNRLELWWTFVGVAGERCYTLGTSNATFLPLRSHEHHTIPFSAWMSKITDIEIRKPTPPRTKLWSHFTSAGRAVALSEDHGVDVHDFLLSRGSSFAHASPAFRNATCENSPRPFWDFDAWSKERQNKSRAKSWCSALRQWDQTRASHSWEVMIDREHLLRHVVRVNQFE
jgi:hypothetical protein